MLKRLTGVHRANIALGNRHFELAVSPARDDAGAVVGYAVEWSYVTERRAQQAEQQSQRDHKQMEQRRGTGHGVSVSQRVSGLPPFPGPDCVWL